MRVFWLSLALICGILLPYGHSLTFLVRYSVMVMLFFAFLEIRIHREIVQRSHAFIAAANVGIAFLAYALLYPWKPELAMVAFITALMPTAAAAPVLTSYLRGNVAYVTVSVLLTTCAVGLVIPLSLPVLIGAESQISLSDTLGPVLFTLLLPLLSAQAIRRWSTSWHNQLLRVKVISYYLFLFNVYIAMSKASHFIQQEMQGGAASLGWILLLSALICGGNYAIGYGLGGKNNRIGGSMALGRKNTMFAVWICLTFLSPLAALGPMGYIVWQNVWNSWQLMRQKSAE
jgi:BASS family bile acid:Na+ symporter